MGTFSTLLALYEGNPLVTGEFPAQRPVTTSFDVSFDLRLNKRLRNQSEGWWFETPSCSLWRHRMPKHLRRIPMAHNTLKPTNDKKHNTIIPPKISACGRLIRIHLSRCTKNTKRKKQKKRTAKVKGYWMVTILDLNGWSDIMTNKILINIIS